MYTCISGGSTFRSSVTHKTYSVVSPNPSIYELYRENVIYQNTPCNKVYEEGIDYVFIRNNKTDDFYQLLSALSDAEKVVEEDHDKECNNKINMS